MRTTIDLPPDLFRRAKARAAERGESLKTLVTRAVAAEIDALDRPARRQRVALPLFGSSGPPVDISSEDIARALADEDAAKYGSPRRR